MSPSSNQLTPQILPLWAQVFICLLKLAFILWILFPPTKRLNMFTLCSQHSSYRSGAGVCSGWGRSVSAAGPAPEGIRLQPLIKVISDCCREGCGVKVSRQSGSVRSAHSVQSALYCKSLLINLMPLAELHSRLKSVTKMKKKKTNTLVLQTVLQHWIWTLWRGLYSCGFVEDAFTLTFSTLKHIIHCNTNFSNHQSVQSTKRSHQINVALKKYE